jgi:hypothetical protein
MAVTQNTYTGNGSTQNFVFTFTYLDPSHVKVKINGMLTTAFTFFNASTLRFNTAPANGASVLIYRETPSDNLLAEYTAGGALRDGDLELTLQQVLNVSQETQTFAENQSTAGLQSQITTANNNASNAVVTANAATTTADAASDTANGIAATANAATATAAAAAATATTATLFTQSGTGAVTRTVDSKLKDVVSVKDFGAVGDGVADDTAALNAAAAAAGFAKKALFVPAGVYKTTAPWVIPPPVYALGESPSLQPGYDPGSLWNYGSIIFKAHTGNGITKTGASAYTHSAPIENITISSNRTAYPGGNGFVIDSVAGANLLHCRAFGVGGDSFVIGASDSANTGNNLMECCYSNNPAGVNYRVRQGYSRINNCLSDGGTYGIHLNNCPLVVVNNFHFEGFTSAGIYLENGCTSLKFNSGLLVNSASALYGVQIANAGGIGNVFNSISVNGGFNTANSVGVSIPSASVNNRILNCEISNWATGVDNNANFGSAHTWVVDTVFYQNNLAIRSNGENTIYRGNSFDSTIGTWDVSHVSGTKGLWSGNTFGKGALGVNPVATGVQGNFLGIRVKDNVGYVSRNHGITGAIASYTNINHGLAGVPAPDIVLVTTSSGTTDLQINTYNSTFFNINHGPGNAQWAWMARLPCDY